MATKQWLLVPQFELFIRDSYRGKRIQASGKKIKSQTVDNYTYTLRCIKDFEAYKMQLLRIKAISGKNIKEISSEKKYWRKFYLNFTDFMYRVKGFYDNYVSSTVKIIKAFFNYLKTDKFLPIGDFYRQFHTIGDDLAIITLMPEQLQFLINDVTFHFSLPTHLQSSKSVFVLGCTVGLRYSDLSTIKKKDIETVGNSTYLSVFTAKTNKAVRIKLPDYAVSIINDFIGKGKNSKNVFPALSTHRFNKNIKKIAEKAGWINEVGKFRRRQGKPTEIYIDACKKSFRFCDMISSHTMRRTAITTMLMLGMPEHVVRKISGHADNSKAFYRYVNLVQSYQDQETDKVFERLAAQ